MIPKKIHYCWFGEKELPPLAQKCIASWKKFLPDYEILRWDESNYDVNKIAYTKEAYNAKKYAFVSDYARFDILYQHGGLYFDTDVEIIKDLTPIIKQGAFMGCEQHNSGINSKYACNPGLGLAVAPGLEVYRKILNHYGTLHFLKENGKLNLTTVVSITTDILKKYGFDGSNAKIQNLAGVKIYPPEYFCPQDFISGKIKITQNTYTIHHFACTWHSFPEKCIISIRRLIGERFYLFLHHYIKR